MLDPNMLKAFMKQVSKEKDLSIDVIKEAIEHAILAASRKQLSAYRDAVCDLDVESGELRVIVTKIAKEDAPKVDRDLIQLKEARKLTGNRKVKDGDEVRVPIDPSELGRIAAQSARQMVMQRLRDAERGKVFDEYKDRAGAMVSGIVNRFERRDVVLNIGKTEAVLPNSEIPSGADYKFNDRLKVMITKVEQTPRGPVINCSRKTPELVIELFKQEVPEIADGTVQIVGIAREAGVRTKIAVKSTNSEVDPVGACVGMKGSRVQMVVRELENEKIDIVPWSIDTATFIRNALNPAKIVEILLDEDKRRADVVVAEGNLAIAIGKKGQNTKLAARLTGYRLDIRSENEDELAYEEIQRRYLEDFISQVDGLTEFYQDSILRSNFNSVDKIAKAEIEKLLPFTGDNETLAQALIDGAGEYTQALREMEIQRKMLREARGLSADDDSADLPEGSSGDAEESSGIGPSEGVLSTKDESAESAEDAEEAEVDEATEEKTSGESEESEESGATEDLAVETAEDATPRD